jgi:hypothetical protein
MPTCLSAETIAARTRFFGYDAVDQQNGRVDKDKVVVSWFSVASFAMAARGHVVLLDSYIYRLADKPGYVPAVLKDLVDLKPEAIFIGHGHGDHSDNAAYIAAKTGAKLFGAAEHCAAFAGDLQRMITAGTLPAGSSISCTSLTTAGSVPGTEVSTINDLYPHVCITSFKHLHSGASPVDPNYPVNLINPVRDPRVAELMGWAAPCAAQAVGSPRRQRPRRRRPAPPSAPPRRRPAGRQSRVGPDHNACGVRTARCPL